MSESTPHLSADDSLPEVEPPSAKFLVQLFVVPGVIVAGIVALWCLINLAVSSSGNPRDYLWDLQRPGPIRWQAAINLADALRGGSHEEFKRDRDSVRRLAGVLQQELEEGSQKTEALELRKYLCKALGEMYVDEGLEVLLLAARTERSPGEAVVRQWAVEAIAVLAAHVAAEPDGGQLAGPQLLKAMRELTRDQNEQVRTAATFTVGVIGGDAMLGELSELLNDPVASVRHNAAIRLANDGDPEALPVIEEIFDLRMQDELRKLQLDQRPPYLPQPQWAYRLDKIRELTVQNALRAIEQYARKQPDADFVPLAKNLRALAETESVHYVLRHQAKALADELAPAVKP